MVSKGFFHIDPFIIVAISSWNNMNPLEHYQLLAFFTHCLFDLKILVMILRKQTIAFLRHIAISPCPDCLAIYKFIIHPNTITHKLSHQHNEITGVIAPFQLCVHTNVSSPRLTKHMTVSLPPRPVMWVQYTLPQTTQTAPGRATSQHR